MVGRGVFNNPYIFSKTDKWQALNSTQKIVIFIKHIELFKNTWDASEKQNFHGLKKFARIYLSDFDGASKLRTEFVRKQTLPEMLEVLNNFS
jgi:tRNA-dihydrouridine synthase